MKFNSIFQLAAVLCREKRLELAQTADSEADRKAREARHPLPQDPNCPVGVMRCGNVLIDTRRD